MNGSKGAVKGSRDLSTGSGCLTTGRCYRWTFDGSTGFFFRGPGLSRNHQPGPRHPAWGLVKAWCEKEDMEASRWMK